MNPVSSQQERRFPLHSDETQVLGLLRDAPEPLTIAQIADRLKSIGLSEDKVRVATWQLVARSLVLLTDDWKFEAANGSASN